MYGKFLAAGLLALPLLSACVVIDADGDGADFTASVHDNGAGSVYGADVTEDTITFRVRSNGCTDEDFFDVDIRRHDGHFHVELDRVRQDNCRATMPNGTLVTWTYKDLGLPPGADIRIANPVRRR